MGAKLPDIATLISAGINPQMRTVNVREQKN